MRAECLDWLLIVGRGHLEQVLRIYVEHDNAHRPHRALRLEPPDPPVGPTVTSEHRHRVHRRAGSAACSTSTSDKLHERVSAAASELDLLDRTDPTRAAVIGLMAEGPVRPSGSFGLAAGAISQLGERRQQATPAPWGTPR
ncbi:MAG TPA: hypothetical protein VJB61_01745 [Actinomycetota bacterium]